MCTSCIIQTCKEHNGMVVGEYVRKFIMNIDSNIKRIDLSFTSDVSLSNVILTMVSFYNVAHQNSALIVKNCEELPYFTKMRVKSFNANTQKDIDIFLLKEHDNCDVKYNFVDVNSFTYNHWRPISLGILDGHDFSSTKENLKNKKFIRPDTLSHLGESEINQLISDGFTEIIPSNETQCRQCRREVFKTDTICWWCETKVNLIIWRKKYD